MSKNVRKLYGPPAENIRFLKIINESLIAGNLSLKIYGPWKFYVRTVYKEIYTQRLIFWSRKVFEGVHITCETCFEKASLVHFFSLRNSGSRVKRQVWSTFRLFEKASLVQIRRKIWTKLAFWKHLPHVIQIIQKRQVWSRFFSESGPNLPFRTIWKWTKLAFWHVIINFEEK